MNGHRGLPTDSRYGQAKSGSALNCRFSSPEKSRRSLLGRTLIWLLLLVGPTAGVFNAAPNCQVGNRPSATLLLPYFEVQLDDPLGMTTLMSIGNRSDDPVLTRMVVWSDWALPVASFDLLLPSNALVPINLRDVLVRGVVPDTIDGIERPPNCTDPLTQQQLDLEQIARQLTGADSPAGSGMCWGSRRGEGTSAAGFVTVDVIADCLSKPRYPGEDGYYDGDEGALATADNVLHGDFFLIDQLQDFAQGENLVSLSAKAEELDSLSGQPSNSMPFGKSGFLDFSRIAPPKSYLTRHFPGGTFGDNGSKLLTWLEPPFSFTEPVACGGAKPGEGQIINSKLIFRLLPEEGASSILGSTHFDPPAYAALLDWDEIISQVFFETLDEPLQVRIGGLWSCGICSPPASGHPLVVMPLHAAGGRFSVGLDGIAIDPNCEP